MCLHVCVHVCLQRQEDSSELLEAGSPPERRVDWLAVSLVRHLPSLSKLWDSKIPSHCLFVNVGSWGLAKALIFLRHVQY